MLTLTATDWLNAWEHSLTLSPALRPCALLAPILPDGQEGAEHLSIGTRDSHLLDLYMALFGPKLEATATCPACGERQEFVISVDDLRETPPESPRQDLAWGDGTIRVRFRLPDSRDLAAIEGAESQEGAERTLLQRCCISVADGDRDIAATDLPGDVVSALSDAMAAADPQALTELALTCPDCGHGWVDALDIGVYLAEALGYWAERLLDQVHLLAGAYGWSERDILGLSPQRRMRYLARVLE